MYCGSGRLLKVVWVLICCKVVFCQQNVEVSPSETVLITSSSNVKYLEVPTSDEPLLTWMEVRKGVFPNISDEPTSVTNVTVGEPVTLFIFFKDESKLYNIKVTDCWAFDDKNPLLYTQKLHLTGTGSDTRKAKILSEWKKYLLSDGALSFLHASFTAIKFPDKDQVYLRCDIQLVGREQVSGITQDQNYLK